MSKSWCCFAFAMVLWAPFLWGQPGGTVADPKLPSVFLAGDSTGNVDNPAGLRGWGTPLADYFDAARINVVNRARAGRSSRTFLTEGLWDQLLAMVKPGDYVLLQFGHNDGGAINDSSRARGSLPGLGEESQEIDNQLTKKHEVVYTFGHYMRKFIADTRARGAHPIVLSLTVRNIWTEGKVERGSGHYSQWAREIAGAEGAPFVDLTTLVADEFERMGVDEVKKFYPGDHTHTNPAGADFNASMVVAGLKGIHSPLAVFVSAKGKAMQAKAVPLDPKLPTLWLIGDSTVRNGTLADGANGQWGWGEPIVDLFDLTKINVVNKALGGTSSRSFLTLGLWEGVLAQMKPGDRVLMQFGHNDNGPVNDNSRARGTIQGVGEETEEIDNLLTKKPEVVHTFGWYLRKYVEDARAKGAIPMICSLIPRKIWKDGKIERNGADYAGWAAQVAAAEKAPFVDLNTIIADRYDAIGEAGVEALFADPHTHTSREGAELNAEAVVAGLKALAGNPLGPYLSAKGDRVARYAGR